ncbi:hypothetical protein V6N13_025265 [Hibiscus sabdariffa]
MSSEQEPGRQINNTISIHKWIDFCAHPAGYTPSLVREFRANLYKPTLKMIFVRESSIPWNAVAINKLFNMSVRKDEHSVLAEDVDDAKVDLLVKNLCIDCAFWLVTKV